MKDRMRMMSAAIPSQVRARPIGRRIKKRGVTARKQKEQHRPHQPAVGEEKTHRNQDADEDQRQPAGALPQKRVKNVPAIELADGKQVQRRREQSHPGRARRGMKINIGGGGAGKLDPLEQPQNQRCSEDQVAPPGNPGNDF